MAMRRSGSLVVGLIFLFAAAPFAHAQKRVALMIGVDTYDNLGSSAQLKKARADAKSVTETLKVLGFEVIHRDDVGRSAFNGHWQDFLNRLSPGDTAVFYFAGHGIELSGRNYLLPRDVPSVRPGRDELLKRESLSLQEFLADLREKGTRLNLVILDACRDNPFEQVAGRSVGATRELAVTEPPEGTFIMFSAGSGESALDRLDNNDKDPNSVYTRQLLPLLRSPGLSLTDVAEQVRVGVRQMASTVQHRQTPAYYNQVLGRMCIAGGDCGPRSAGGSTAGQPSEAERAWSLAKDATSVAVLEAFIARYKDTFHADLARARINELKRQQVALAAPPRAPAVPKAAEPAVVAPPITLSEAAQPFTMANPLTLKLQDTFPTKDTSSRDPLNAIVRDLTALSGGKLKLELLGAGTVAPAFQVLDAVSNGALDAAWTSPSYWYGRSKAFGIFAGMVPGGLNAAAFVQWMEGDGAAELNRLIADVTQKRARSLPCAVMGPGGDWLKKAIVKIDDFRGLKFRSIGLPAEVGKEIGVSVMILSAGEIVPPLDKGVIDGSDWSTPESAIVLGLPDVAKFLFYPGWSRPVHLYELLVSEFRLD